MHPYPECCPVHLAAVSLRACGKLSFPHQLQVSHEAAAAAARRKKESRSKVLRSKDTTFEEESDTRSFSAALRCFHCLPGNILKPFTLRRCEAPINTDETNKLCNQRN